MHRRKSISLNVIPGSDTVKVGLSPTTDERGGIMRHQSLKDKDKEQLNLSDYPISGTHSLPRLKRADSGMNFGNKLNKSTKVTGGSAGSFGDLMNAMKYGTNRDSLSTSELLAMTVPLETVVHHPTPPPRRPRSANSKARRSSALRHEDSPPALDPGIDGHHSRSIPILNICKTESCDESSSLSWNCDARDGTSNSPINITRLFIRTNNGSERSTDGNAPSTPASFSFTSTASSRSISHSSSENSLCSNSVRTERAPFPGSVSLNSVSNLDEDPNLIPPPLPPRKKKQEPRLFLADAQNILELSPRSLGSQSDLRRKNGSGDLSMFTNPKSAGLLDANKLGIEPMPTFERAKRLSRLIQERQLSQLQFSLIAVSSFPCSNKRIPNSRNGN